MKKYYFITVLAMFMLWSCGSDTESKTNTQGTDNNIIEESPQKQAAPKQEVKINENFAAFLGKFAKASLPYKEEPKGDEKYKKIPVTEQASYLSKAEDLSAEELEEMKDYTDFYYVSNPLNTNKYHAIVYGRFEMGSIYYFLCTYDNDGKLISNIDFASYEMQSAGPQSGQEHFTKGFISDNNEIQVKTDEETLTYKITEQGKIVKK